MSIIGVFSSFEKVKKAARREIKEDNMEWEGCRGVSETDCIDDLNTALKYGYVELYMLDEDIDEED